MPLTALKDDLSEKASQSRVATIREGLEQNPEHRVIWIRAARYRIEELEKRDAWFGLEPFEAEEVAVLRELIQSG